MVPVPLLALSLLIDGPAAVGSGFAHIGWHGALSTVYTAGLCSLVGYAIFNRLLSSYPSGQVVPWVLLAPVVAMASSWALLGETPGTAELADAALLVVGVLSRPGHDPRPPRRLTHGHRLLSPCCCRPGCSRPGRGRTGCRRNACAPRHP